MTIDGRAGWAELRQPFAAWPFGPQNSPYGCEKGGLGHQPSGGQRTARSAGAEESDASPLGGTNRIGGQYDSTLRERRTVSGHAATACLVHGARYSHAGVRRAGTARCGTPRGVGRASRTPRSSWSRPPPRIRSISPLSPGAVAAPSRALVGSSAREYRLISCLGVLDHRVGRIHIGRPCGENDIAESAAPLYQPLHGFIADSHLQQACRTPTMRLQRLCHRVRTVHDHYAPSLAPTRAPHPGWNSNARPRTWRSYIASINGSRTKETPRQWDSR